MVVPAIEEKSVNCVAISHFLRSTQGRVIIWYFLQQQSRCPVAMMLLTSIRYEVDVKRLLREPAFVHKTGSSK